MVIGESQERFQRPGLANVTIGHSELDKTVKQAGESSLLMTQEENETQFGEHVAFSLPKEVFPFHLLWTFVVCLMFFFFSFLFRLCIISIKTRADISICPPYIHFLRSSSLKELQLHSRWQCKLLKYFFPQSSK